MKITVGADPEIFLSKNGKFVSAHNLIPGNKHEPFRVKNGAIQVDGMAAEFNISPASSLKQFQFNISSVLTQLKKFVPEYEFLNVASVNFDDIFKKEIPTENLILGCEPDFNAYSLSVNPKPNANKNIRTAGGHIHIGGFKTLNPFHPTHFKAMSKLIQILDETIGIYSLFWDKDDERRSLYGQAGAFRPKSYGCEYRTLSNAWIFNKDLIQFVYNQVEKSVELFEGKWEPNPQIPQIINMSYRDNDYFKQNKVVNMIKEMVNQ